jgi:hypothetical protein
MFSRNLIAALAIAACACLLISGGYGQTISGASSVSLGALTQSSFSGLGTTGPYSIGSMATKVPSVDSLPANSSSINATMVNVSSINRPSAKALQTPAVINLSNYASDRRNKNLTGYTNIMYPIAESAGFTASAAGGGGCNCGGG